MVGSSNVSERSVILLPSSVVADSLRLRSMHKKVIRAAEKRVLTIASVIQASKAYISFVTKQYVTHVSTIAESIAVKTAKGIYNFLYVRMQKTISRIGERIHQRNKSALINQLTVSEPLNASPIKPELAPRSSKGLFAPRGANSIDTMVINV